MARACCAYADHVLICQYMPATYVCMYYLYCLYNVLCFLLLCLQQYMYKLVCALYILLRYCATLVQCLLAIISSTCNMSCPICNICQNTLHLLHGHKVPVYTCYDYVKIYKHCLDFPFHDILFTCFNVHSVNLFCFYLRTLNLECGRFTTVSGLYAIVTMYMYFTCSPNYMYSTCTFICSRKYMCVYVYMYIQLHM